MRRLHLLITLLLGAWLGAPALAHEVRPAYLEIRETAPDTYDVLWKVPAMGDMRLGVYVDLPDEAVSLGEPRGAFVDGAYLERLRVRCPGGLSGHTIRIAGLESTRIDVLARVEHASGAVQSARLFPSNPSFVVEAEPSTWSVARAYTVLGIEHILLGVDHLLFVLVLLLLVKGWKRLVETITTFTIAHSLTLAAATLGVINVPGPPVEACIALSIVFVACEVVHVRQGRASLTERAPWLVAFTFGLLHGLGFAGALHDVGLPRTAIPAALLFFNVGVELGQLAFIGVALSVVAVVRHVPARYPSWSWRVAPYAIGSVAMFWVIQRTSGFVA